MSQEQAIRIYPSVRKLVSLLIPFTIFVIGSTLFAAGSVHVGASEGSVFLVVTGALLGVGGVAIFGAIAVYLAYRLRVRQPMLVIDADGIWHHWGPMPVGLIHWAEIETVVSYTRDGSRLLGVVLRDREAFKRRLPRLRRWLLALQRPDVPPVSIEQEFLPIDVDTLAAQIKGDYGVKLDRGRWPRSTVPFKSCHIEYDLTRRQRLVAHLGVWALFLPLVILGGGGGAVAIIGLSVAVSPWFAPLIIVPLWFARRFIAGLLNVIFVRIAHFDITIEENGLSCETKGGLWTFGVEGNFDGIIKIHRYSRDTWTMLTFEGLVISIPVDAIEQQYIDHIRAKVEMG